MRLKKVRTEKIENLVVCKEEFRKMQSLQLEKQRGYLLALVTKRKRSTVAHGK